MAKSIKGTFNSNDNTRTYQVEIFLYSLNQNITIEDTHDDYFDWDGEHIFFGPDPVSVTIDHSDPFTHVKVRSATVTLISNMNLVKMFKKDFHENAGNNKSYMYIRMNGVTNGYLFCGYIENDVFEQGYAYNYSSFTFNAVDPFGLMNNTREFCKINHNNYESNNGLTYLFDIPAQYNNSGLYSWASNYDMINRGYPYGWFQHANSVDNLKVSLDVFGLNTDLEQNWPTDNEYIEELYKYNNHYILLDPMGNMRFGPMLWPCDYNYLNDNIHYTKDDAASNDTSISLSDTYSVIKVNCEIEPVEKVLDFADDTVNDTGMYSPFRNKQKYMTEYIALGEGEDATNGFRDMVIDNKATTYDAGYIIDNYVYVKKSDAWDFSAGYEGNDRNNQDYTTQIEMDGQYAINMHKILKWMANDTYIRPAWLGFARSNKINVSDDTPSPSYKIKDYLYIPIWGTEEHDNSTMQSKFNRYTSEHPLAKYTPYQNITLTPASENVTNYIIISGKMILNPLQQVTGTHWKAGSYSDIFNYRTWDEDIQRMLPKLWYIRSTNTFDDTVDLLNSRGSKPSYYCVPHEDHTDDGAYYTQKFWGCRDVADKTYTAVTDEKWAYGYLENKSNRQLKYEYSGKEDSNVDKISKIALLKCELKVGDKYCCELEEGEDNFEWLTAEEAAQRNIEPVIYLGINPKIDDYIVGESHKITNTINDIMNLDSEGMAIPIKSTDAVSGIFEFKIITPMHPVWCDLKYTHATFWRHSSWHEYYRYIMEKTQAIMIEDLSIEIQNDNALADVDMTTTDNDLVYASDMNPLFNEEQEIDLKICTGLSSDECAEYDIANQTSNTFVVDTSLEANAPYLGERDNSRQDGEFYIKQEQKIVDAMYKECCNPKTIITTTIKQDYSNASKINELNVYKHVNDLYYIDWVDPNIPTKLIKAVFDPKYGTAECTFKEFDKTLVNA